MKRRLQLLVRGFFLEASFNPRTKQRGGLAWIVRPNETERKNEPFNTNPTLAGYLTGWLGFPSGEAPLPPVAAMASALGGIGDRIVWGLLRPLAVVCSLLVSVTGMIPAAAVLLLVYNPAEVGLRWRAITRGTDGGKAIGSDLAAGGLPRISGPLARIGAMAVGVGVGFGGMSLALADRITELSAAAAVIATGWILLRRRSPGAWSIPIGAILLGLLWVLVAGHP